MKLHMDIPRGYRDTRIATLQQQYPDWDELQIVARFADDLYGAWIRTNISDDFAIVEVTENNFRIDFTYEDDANAFRRQIGGQIVEA